MGEHLSADDVFYRLVDSIYESAMDVAAMPAALDLFSHYTCSASPSYLIWDKLAGRARLGVTPHGCFTSASSMPENMRVLPSRAVDIAIGLFLIPEEVRVPRELGFVERQGFSGGTGDGEVSAAS